MDAPAERAIVRDGGTGEDASVGCVQAVTAAVEAVRVRDERVGVRCRLQIAVLVHVELSLGELGVVLLQVHRVERFA